MAIAAFDLVADGTHGVDVLTGGWGRTHSSWRCPGNTGEASPQPMVTATSAACTISSVQGLGYTWEISTIQVVDGGMARPVDRRTLGRGKRMAAHASSSASSICAASVSNPTLESHNGTSRWRLSRVGT